MAITDKDTLQELERTELWQSIREEVEERKQMEERALRICPIVEVKSHRGALDILDWLLDLPERWRLDRAYDLSKEEFVGDEQKEEGDG